MKLFNDKDEFNRYVRLASDFFEIDPSQIEKDYFITLLLQNAFLHVPGLVFKGGTSLSKCHKIINRFSEDIDLTLDLSHSSQTFKRNSLRILIKLCDQAPFSLNNKDVRLKHTHANYNLFNISYLSAKQNNGIREIIKMEMVYLSKCYPSEDSVICSYIGEYLIANNRQDLVGKYELEPFPIQVQSLSRTLVDKVFAICDYFLRNEVRRNSRHIYDIAMLLSKIKLDETLRSLIESVREERKKSPRSVSAQDNISINGVLKQIIDTRFFEQDFNTITSVLLFKPYTYENSIDSLRKIIESNLF